jgi:hypothetical protein
MAVSDVPAAVAATVSPARCTSAYGRFTGVYGIAWFGQRHRRRCAIERLPRQHRHIYGIGRQIASTIRETACAECAREISQQDDEATRAADTV